ncbi:MAG: hypothetical protein AVDCRST_MAG79-2229, partial [uncultured Thermoleophilia bacterium]
ISRPRTGPARRARWPGPIPTRRRRSGTRRAHGTWRARASRTTWSGARPSRRCPWWHGSWSSRRVARCSSPIRPARRPPTR